MARIYTTPKDEKPKINKSAVLDFFEQRATKVSTLGPTRAVIYQDKSPDLAERRDTAEKNLLLPLLSISQSSHILDAGCGTGRWAEAVVPHCASYFGVDVSPGLIKVAHDRFGSHENVRFAVCPVDALSKEALGTERLFTHILSFGVFIYLNDDEVLDALSGYAALGAPGCRLIFREPVALEQRLTLLEHFSDEMDQQYNAIYRTEQELISLIKSVLGDAFIQVDSGDVYPDPSLNNRTETRQKWFLWEKH
ncbi:Methyltransferase family protein [Pseudomonas sp. IT-P2]|uniref:class I SAM-dependent methyltransferase n=1 Tax=Pseudomonas sp. IT-P2 TaxID=3026456 RepID=UPI0039E042E6